MASRFASLAATVLLLLCFTAAQAAELQRRVTLLDGTAHTGVIVERGDGYVVLQRSDGTAIELSLDAIDEIEVLTGGTTPESWAPRENKGAEEPPARRPRFEADWAGDLDEAESARDWQQRYAQATAAQVFAVGSSIPLMAIGLIETASAPLVIGGANTSARAGIGAIGVTLLAGSVGTAAAGAALARKSYGQRQDPGALRAGIVLGLAGTASYAAIFALTHGMLYGEVSSQNGLSVPPVMVLMGLSAGAVIVGNAMLMTDAKVSRDKAEEELDRTKRRRRAGRAAPQLLAVWGAPLEGGLSGGVSMMW